MKHVKSLAFAGLLVIGLALVGCGDDGESASSEDTETPAVTSSTTTTTSSAANTGAASAEATTIEVVAEALKFDTDEITVPAETEITVVLDNQDASVPHNISFYTAEDAGEEIYKGELVTGVASIDETFTSPEAGEYFFRCDVHPDTMTGTFIVE